MKKILVLLMVFLFSGIMAVGEERPEPGKRILNEQTWLQDLDYVVKILRTRHPYFHYHLPSQEFSKLISELKKDIPKITNEEIVIRMMKLIASIQDGHTQIYPYGDLHFDTWFPLRFKWFADGVFVSAVDMKYKNLLGCRVEKIGNLPIKEAFKKASNLVFADNHFGQLYGTPLFLSNAKVLKILNIISAVDVMPLEIEIQKRGKQAVTIKAVKSRFDAFWFYRPNIGPPGGEYISIFSGNNDNLPLHLKNRLKYFWFYHNKIENFLYLQINATDHSPEETFQQFTERFFNYVEKNINHIGKLIIDLRYNTGGNGYLILPFVHEFIRHDEINQVGKLYAIISNNTVSAGMKMLGLLKRHTKIISVGEPPGSSINFFSDANVFELPNSGMYMWVSSLYNQNGHPADKSYYSPDVPFLFSGKDYFSGKDPVIEAITKNQIKLLPDILLEKGRETFLKEYENITKKTSPLNWWKPNSKSMFMDVGKKLLEAKKYKDALVAFELNTKTFPEFWNIWIALACTYAEMGEYDKALEVSNNALNISPANGFIWQHINQIKQKKKTFLFNKDK